MRQNHDFTNHGPNMFYCEDLYLGYILQCINLVIFKRNLVQPKAAHDLWQPFKKESSAAKGCTGSLAAPKGPFMHLCGLKAAHILFIMI